MENKKQGFFTRAFHDMKESAKIQAQVDKAEFAAKKAEAKADFEENRGTISFEKAKQQGNRSSKQERIKDEAMEKIKQAEQRKEEAEKRYEAARAERNRLHEERMNRKENKQ